MDRITEIEMLFGRGREAMLSGDFATGGRSYERAIQLLHELEENPAADTPKAAIRTNLANAYCDLASCILETCGPRVNPAVHALLSAIKYGNTESGVFQNVLYCMSQVNACTEAAVKSAPHCARRDELMRWHNQGYDLLKTPFPPGTSSRNWDGSIESFGEAIRITPDFAASYHGLGLACEGAHKEMDAINAWLKVKALEPDYDFERRFFLE